MAFRRGDEGEMGHLGALIVADSIYMVRALVKGWFTAHGKK